MAQECVKYTQNSLSMTVYGTALLLKGMVSGKSVFPYNILFNMLWILTNHNLKEKKHITRTNTIAPPPPRVFAIYNGSLFYRISCANKYVAIVIISKKLNSHQPFYRFNEMP